MIECILILKLLVPGSDPLHSERVQVCTQLIKTANEYVIPPALVLSVAWVESNWTRQNQANSSGVAGPMQIKTRYWCLDGGGEWNPSKPFGLLKGCDLFDRGVFSLAYYLDRFQDLDRALCNYSASCGSDHYIRKVMRIFQRIKPKLRSKK